MKSILILTASFGEGHNAAARNLCEALRASSPETKTIVDDAFLAAYPRLNRVAQRAYLTLINRAPSLWQFIFDLLDRTRIVEQHIGLYRAAARHVEQLISTHRPEVIISTYPGCNHLLDFVCRGRLKRPFRTVTIVTDSLTINSVWHRAHSDCFIVANSATAEALQNAGIAPPKIRTLGFPVPRLFATLQVHRPVPPSDGKWRVLYVVNSGRHQAIAIVRQLLSLENIALTVTVGHDESLKKQMAALASEINRPLDLHGWAPDMPRHMAESHLLISKAGGATVQESLAAQTPMLITQIIPGQEEGNARLLLEGGAGALATDPAAIADTVRSALANEGAQWKAWHQAVLTLSKPAASDDIARFVLGL